MRKRVLESGTAAVPDSLKRQAVDFFVENNAANEHGTKAKNIRKALFADMLAAGVKAFRATFVGEAGSVDLSVEIGPGRATSEVDMAMLRQIVGDDEKLLSLCTMTKTAVSEHFGTLIADRVSKPVAGTENVQVKVAK